MDAPAPSSRLERIPLPLALLLAALLAVFLLNLRTIAHGGFFTNLASGRWIAAHGVPVNDPFSFASPGRWVNDHWLYDLAAYLLWRVGGAGLLVVAHAALAAGAMALLFRRMGTDAAAALAAIGVAWLAAPAFPCAPATAAALFAAATLVLAGAAAGRGRTIGLLALQLAWTNGHESFWLGPLLALVAAGLRADGARERWFAVPAAMAVLTLANPYGYRLHQHAWLGLTQAGAATAEWISPFAAEFGRPLSRYLTLGILGLALAGFAFGRGRRPGAELAPAAAGAALCFLAPAQLPVAAVLLAPFLASGLRDLGAARPAGAVAAGLAVLATLLAVTTNRYYVATGSAASLGARVEETMFPAAPLVELLRPPGAPGRVMNFEDSGGYLAWVLPDREIFIDDRARLFPPALRAETRGVLRGDPVRAEAWLARWRPDAVLLSAATPGADLALRVLTARAQFRLAYFDGASALLVRNTRANLRWTQNEERQAAGLRQLEAARGEYERRLGGLARPAVPAPLVGAARVFHARNQPREGEAVSRLLVRGAPGWGSGWFYLGVARKELGLFEDATHALREAARRQPNRADVWAALADAYRALGRAEDAAAAQSRAAALKPAAP